MADALRWTPIALSLRTLRRALLVLLTTLVLVQTVGVLHRVAHATGSAHSLPSMTVDAAPHEAASTTNKTTVLTRLWGEHSSLVDCQLFDQACPDVLHHVVLDAVITAAPQVWYVVSLQERFALFERFYAARGPPALL
jgi:hypothetical protein